MSGSSIRLWIAPSVIGFMLLMLGCSTPQYATLPRPQPAPIITGADQAQSRIDAFTSTPTPYAFKNEVARDIVRLPLPAQKVPVAVYRFEDQTGQNRQTTLSKAVTQGGGPILVNALYESGWFDVVEREGLQDILVERRLVKKTLGDVNKTDRELGITDLRPADYIISGGIISYDSDLRTGGKGLSYLGTGGGTQYREDRVGVALRLVDIGSGRVIESVTVAKKIVSKETSLGVFRFIKFRRLLEAEAGYTTNEPVQEIVKDAIEAAVIQLVSSGLAKGLWQARYAEDTYAEVFDPYAKETLKQKVKRAGKFNIFE